MMFFHSNIAFADVLIICADLKRELIAREVRAEIFELNSPTALQRFPSHELGREMGNCERGEQIYTEE
jgi:hypothetical protein